MKVSTQFTLQGGPMVVVLGSRSERLCIVYIDGPLVVPVNQDLATRVRGLLQRGAHRIVLDLSSVVLIDAGGVGELVRAYNIACAMNVSLRIVNTRERAREALARVGLLDFLSADGDTTSSRSLVGPAFRVSRTCQ